MPHVARLAPIVAIALALLASHVQGEVVTIDVTVKSIDAKERTITVTKTSKTKSKDIELEIGKTAKIIHDGKDAALDSIKPGQKVSVSYETELEVVTKIEIGEAGDEPPSVPLGRKETGCRVVWTITETGDCVLTISRPTESREAAKESLVRHDDGTVEFQHDFDTEEGVDRALMGSAEGVAFDKSRKTLVLTPKKGEGAKFSYAKLTQLPVTLEFDLEGADSSGGVTLIVSISRRDKNVEFPVLNLASKDNFKTTAVVSCGWVSGRDSKGAAQFQSRLTESTLELGEPKEFKFTLPRMTGDQPCIVNFGVRGDSPATLQHLAVRGRLVPTLGIGLAEKSGGVIAEKVLPKGLGETVGIKPGDVLLTINGSKPKSVKEAMELLATIRFGEESEIVVKRGTKTLKMGFTAE